MVIINIILIITWLVIIFILSNQDGNKSYGLSNKVITNTYNIKHNNKDNISIKDIINKYSFLVRKLAHLTLYFILALLIMNLLNILNIKYKVIITLITCFIYACTDEFHQYFIQGRTSTFKDVIIDTIGSIIGIILYIMINNII